jgi:hypothetical protein
MPAALSRIRWRPPKRAVQEDLIIQGHKASKNEWNLAWAFDTVHLDYKFQEAFFHGHRLRGGIVVDFILQTVPLPTPVWVHGEYWHQNAQELVDRYQYALVFYMMRGQLGKPEIVWGRECETKELALATVRRRFT